MRMGMRRETLEQRDVPRRAVSGDYRCAWVSGKGELLVKLTVGRVMVWVVVWCGGGEKTEGVFRSVTSGKHLRFCWCCMR